MIGIDVMGGDIGVCQLLREFNRPVFVPLTSQTYLAFANSLYEYVVARVKLHDQTLAGTNGSFNALRAIAGFNDSRYDQVPYTSLCRILPNRFEIGQRHLLPERIIGGARVGFRQTIEVDECMRNALDLKQMTELFGHGGFPNSDRTTDEYEVGVGIGHVGRLFSMRHGHYICKLKRR